MVLLESILYGKVVRGAPAPRFVLPGIDNRMHSLLDYQDKKAVFVVFMCNHCPYVLHKIGDIVALDKEFPELQVIGINSNDPSQYEEDSFEGMKKFAQEHGVEFPYLVDSSQEVAKSYGATCTPDMFLLDGKLNMAYHGRFDDSLEPGQPKTTEEMREAVLQLLDRKPVTVEAKPSIGCSIKWK